MDGTVSTCLSGFSSDADWSAAAQGRRVNNERLHVTRGRGGKPRQKISPPGVGFLGITISPLHLMTRTDQESSSRGHRETKAPRDLRRRPQFLKHDRHLPSTYD